MDRLEEACTQWQLQEESLREFEDSLMEIDVNVLSEYRRLYQTKGGEQFRPDPERFSCKRDAQSKLVLTIHL